MMRNRATDHFDLPASRDHPAHHFRALAYTMAAVCLLIVAAAVSVTVAASKPPTRCQISLDRL